MADVVAGRAPSAQAQVTAPSADILSALVREAIKEALQPIHSAIDGLHVKLAALGAHVDILMERQHEQLSLSPTQLQPHMADMAKEISKAVGSALKDFGQEVATQVGVVHERYSLLRNQVENLAADVYQDELDPILVDNTVPSSPTTSAASSSLSNSNGGLYDPDVCKKMFQHK